jgi:cytochrome c biogenesis protein ResB
VSAWLAAPEAFTYQGRRYTLSLRARRYYKPFYLTLLDFTHENYPGTDIPKSFSSRVRIHRPDTGEDREVLIYMNHPLRYEGETFYQSGYDPRDPTVTILQVVRNPGWLIPYISSTLISLGLLFQFLKHLGGFLRRKKTAK